MITKRIGIRIMGPIRTKEKVKIMETRIIWLGIVFLLSAVVCAGQTRSVPKVAALGDLVIECPAQFAEPGKGVLTGVPMEYKPGYGVPVPVQDFLDTIPAGWDYKSVQTYTGQSYHVLDHKIVNDKLVCYYGISTGSPHGMNFIAIQKPVPGNRSCQADDGFKFNCKMKVIRKK
jgi:hypothetical protein